MVEVVAHHRVGTVLIDDCPLVPLVLGYDVSAPITLADGGRDIRDDVAPRSILDGVDRVEPETVESISLDPPARRVDDRPPDRGARIVDRGAPGGGGSHVKKLGREAVHVGPVRPHVVVDRVEDD